MIERENPEYIRILKYLNFQKIDIDSELLIDIHKIDTNTDLSSLNIDLEKSNNIKKELEIFRKVEKNYLYYILILETLPNDMIINLFRYFSYNYIRQYNLNIKNEKKKDNEKMKNLKKIVYYPQKYKMKDIILSSNPITILIDNINYLNNKDKKITKYFIKCINNFFL